MLSNTRQVSELKFSDKLINRSIENINSNQTLDIVSIDIRDAITALSTIIGDDFTEDLLDGIFKNFCIGK